MVKHVMPGDSVHSLLSILDVITVRFISASLNVSVYSLCYYCDVSHHVFTLCRDIQPPIRPYQPALQLRPPFSVFLLQPFSRCLRNILKHWSGLFRYRLLHTAKYKPVFELKIANVSFWGGTYFIWYYFAGTVVSVPTLHLLGPSFKSWFSYFCVLLVFLQVHSQKTSQ